MRSTLVFLVLAAGLLPGCGTRETGTAQEEPQVEQPAAELLKLKPPSELALLMRDMVAFTDSSRERMERGAELLPYPDDFRRLHTATPTDNKLEIDRISYTVFADDYLRRVKDYYDAAETDRTRTFNAMVNSCAACHGSACPGPLVKIKKMYSEEKPI